MNHVLDFNVDNSHLSAAHLDLNKPTDLSVIAEEVVEGVFLAYLQPTINCISGASGDFPRGTRIPRDLHAVRPDVKVILDIAPTDWIYHAPPGAVRRIIMNLFSNAFKYTAAGQERNVVLTVSDTGKGISKEFLRGKLFTPFAQEDSLAVGSGLGLSSGASSSLSVNRAVLGFDHVQHRGPALRQNPLLEGHEGRTLAILGAEVSDAPNDPNWADLSRYITDWYGRRFVSMLASEAIDLILADELPSETVISQGSATMQTALLVFSDQYIGPVEAVKRQDDDSYDIIFIVKTFPCRRWMGFEAARAIRALEKERSPDSTPAMIIALTGLSSSEDGSKALASGMDMFMTKPVSFKNIGKLLKGWTEKRSERE
ncbi:uncharacterized protein N7458_002130 [Penicillium daleae]|uniref:Response regulatory domain-containing protein n=1 Tax=Penicillium daleae TaxID=63821 RepID=A0AAD6CE52_9EURO|nr:uncharacterized protein N7458_002130 [Penicillium daleae]KAJ5460578.1 hypothetical protein N7458_002130 [Penicillium daleae]